MVIATPSTYERTTLAAPAGSAVRHANRPEWGTGVFVWEREDKRAYQFEDGKFRVFAKGYYHLLKPTAAETAEQEQLRSKLRQDAEVSLAQREASRHATGSPDVTRSLEDQLALLRIDYPAGFRDPSWHTDVRGQGVPRRLKRHRDPALEQAARLLDASILQSFVDRRQPAEIWGRAIEVLQDTDLVTPKQLRVIKNLGEDNRDAYAKALMTLLHGDETLAHRIDQYVKALSPASCSWQLATAPLALVRPQEHICVRPASFRRQARWWAPGLSYSATPTGRRYLAWQQLAARLRDRLTLAGERPRDYLDVYDFIRLTTRTGSPQRR